MTEVLEEAAWIISERENNHGTAEENMARIADMWSIFLNVELTPADACHLMIMLKLCRIASGEPIDDHYVDIAGYTELAARCQNE